MKTQKINPGLVEVIEGDYCMDKYVCPFYSPPFTGEKCRLFNKRLRSIKSKERKGYYSVLKCAQCKRACARTFSK